MEALGPRSQAERERQREPDLNVGPGAFAPVAATSRSGCDESLHHGAVVALAADGSLAWAAGDPDVAIYARSALKPLQAAAMLAAGLDVDDRQLAVVCASHDGCPEHVDVVRTILAGVGLSETDLGNTPSFPINDAAHDDVVRAGLGPTALRQNCSGKHAGMLATAVVNGWDVASYLDPEHPVQRLINDHVAAATGAVHHVGVDGCGAPTAVVGLTGLARAVRELVTSGHRVHAAMTSFPELVGGRKRDVTRLMRLVPGLLAKDGAEGVEVVAAPNGVAVAVKIADGAHRARTPVVVAALRSLGVELPPGPSDSLAEPVLGHGRPVGRVRSLVGGET